MLRLGSFRSAPLVLKQTHHEAAVDYFLPEAFFGDFLAAFLVAGFLVDLAGVFLVVFLAAAMVGSFRGCPQMKRSDPLGHP